MFKPLYEYIFSYRLLLILFFILIPILRRNDKICMVFNLAVEFIKIKFDFINEFIMLKKGKKCLYFKYKGTMILIDCQRKSPKEIGLVFEIKKKDQLISRFQLYPGQDAKLSPKFFGGDQIIIYKNNRQIGIVNSSETLNYLEFIKTIKSF